MGQTFRRKDPHHEIIALPGKPTVVFITLCCTNPNLAWVASPTVHELLQSIWREATAWKIARYVLMPEHLHFLAFPGQIDYPFRRWMSYWKREFTIAHKCPQEKFETDYWDITIRSSAHYEERCQYMRMNPVKRGLVADPAEWPYQGIIHDFIWMEH